MSVPGVLIGPSLLSASTETTVQLNAASEKAATVFYAPKTGSITDIGIQCESVVSPPTMDARLETVDASFRPTGTLATTNSNKTYTPAAGFTWHTLTAAHSATAGDLLASVIAYSAGTIGASNHSTYLVALAELAPFIGVNNALVDTTGAWVDQDRVGCIAVRYSDGEVAFCTPAVSDQGGAVSAGTALAVKEHAIKFTPEVAFDVLGVLGAFRAATGGAVDVNINLYEDSRTSRASLSVDGNAWMAASGPRLTRFPLAPYTVAAGTTYRASFTPQNSAANTWRHFPIKCPDEASLQAIAGLNVCYSEWDGSVWTDYDNGTDGYWAPAMWIVASGLTAGGGGGSGVGRGMPRGAV